MIIQSAHFIIGAAHQSQVPQDQRPQIAFLGRSNVGKSSLLNTLMGVKGLVKTSAKPGKTREINFFLINEAFYLVDLPGIGYAKVSKEKRTHISTLIRTYIEKTPELRGVVYLIDSRHVGMDIDKETVNTLRDLGVPILLVGSKKDKLNQKELVQARKQLMQHFELDQPPLMISSLKKTGFQELGLQILEAVHSEINITNDESRLS